jgi:hypothetical protein
MRPYNPHDCHNANAHASLILTYVFVATANTDWHVWARRQTLVIAMPERNWEREVHEALALEASREASVLHNPKQARLLIERGVTVALVVVLTFGVAFRGLVPSYRFPLLVFSVFGAIVALTHVSVGLVALAIQRLRKPARPTRDDDSRAIGW